MRLKKFLINPDFSQNSHTLQLSNKKLNYYEKSEEKLCFKFYLLK